MAHARLTRVDVAPALERPGVLAAFSGADLAEGLGSLPCAWPAPPLAAARTPPPPRPRLRTRDAASGRRSHGERDPLGPPTATLASSTELLRHRDIAALERLAAVVRGARNGAVSGAGAERRLPVP